VECELNDFGDFPGLEAGCTHVEAFGCLADQGADLLNVRIPATVRASVGVRNLVAESWPFAAHVAVRSHSSLLKCLAWKMVFGSCLARTNLELNELDSRWSRALVAR